MLLSICDLDFWQGRSGGPVGGSTWGPRRPKNLTNDWSEAPLRLTTLWLPCGSNSIVVSSCGPLERSLSSDLDSTSGPRLQTYLGQVSPSHEKHSLSWGAVFFPSSQPQSPKNLTLFQKKTDKYLTLSPQQNSEVGNPPPSIQKGRTFVKAQKQTRGWLRQRGTSVILCLTNSSVYWGVIYNPFYYFEMLISVRGGHWT